MGNYSWLIWSTGQPEKVRIDWSKVDETIINKGYPYFYTNKCKTLKDLGNELNDHKFFGYWDNDTEKKLIAINKALTGPDNVYPRLYFEEEGWNRLHFIEFHPGTDDVYHGHKIFNFDYEPEPEDASDIWIDTQEEHRKKYALSIVKNPSNWTCSKVEISQPLSALDKAYALLLVLNGLRHEDIKNDPVRMLDLTQKAMKMSKVINK